MGAGKCPGSKRVPASAYSSINRVRVTFDNTGETVELTGQALTDPGLSIRLPSPLSSELLLLEES